MESEHARQLRHERQKRYRDRKKAKKTESNKFDQTLADDAIERIILNRGKELTEMMRTPTCMWRPEWFPTEDVDD